MGAWAPWEARGPRRPSAIDLELRVELVDVLPHLVFDVHLEDAHLLGLGLEELLESQAEEMGILEMYIEHKMWEHIDELNTEFKVDG